MPIGILALQGAFVEHGNLLANLGVKSVEIRQRSHLLKSLDGLIVPGGESTVMAKLLKDLDLTEAIGDVLADGMPIFGTCAGMILLSKEIDDGRAGCLPVLNTIVRRNAYGRQLGSFRTNADFVGVGSIPMVFIRAPYVVRAGVGVEVLAVVENRVVAVRQKNVLATAFHPELTDDMRVHAYFLREVCRTTAG